MSVDREKLLAEAQRCARRGDMRKAADCYQSLSDAFPDDRVLLQRLADALARSGQDEAARTALERLGETYRQKGDRNRSVAVLRRAVRIGEPDPRLLTKLGRWLLEQGLAADARGPLEEAAGLLEERQDWEAARAVHLLILDNLPDDPDSLAEVLRLGEKQPASPQLALERARLAEAFGRRGDREMLLLALRACLDADPEGMARKAEMDRLVKAWIPAREPLPASAEPELDGPASTLWIVFRARILGELERGEDARGLLMTGLAGPDRWGEWERLAAAEALTDLGATDAACKALIDLSASVDSDRSLELAVTDALTRLLTRDPGQHAAMARLQELLPTPGPAPGSSPVVTQPAPTVRTMERDLDPGARARLLEARSLLAHGLAAEAEKALSGLSAEARRHPEIAQVLEGIGQQLKADRAAVRPSSPVRKRQETEAPRPETGKEGEWVIDFDDDEPPASVAGRPHPRGAGAHPGGKSETGSSHSAQTPRAADPLARQQKAGLAALDRYLAEALPEEDAETQYQMAIGLLEMELQDQALPLLEELASGGRRAVDAVLLLLRCRGGVSGDEGGRLLGFAERALVSADATAGSRIELLAGAAQLASRLGRAEESQGLVEQLRGLDPKHPLLASLSGSRDASKT